jgi:hypothetical protein
VARDPFGHRHIAFPLLYNGIGDNPEQKLMSLVKDSADVTNPCLLCHTPAASIVDPEAVAAAPRRDAVAMEALVRAQIPLIDGPDAHGGVRIY